MLKISYSSLRAASSGSFLYEVYNNFTLSILYQMPALLCNDFYLISYVFSGQSGR